MQVLITQSGAAPSELESQVTKKIEDAVASLNGVWHVMSTVTDGSSSTIVQFNVGSVDIDRALNDVKDQIAKIRGDLPRTIDEPVVSRIDVEGLPIVTYAASAPGMTVEQLSWFIDDVVARELQSVRGVGEVKRNGGVDREIRVSLDPEKLLALGVTAATVNEQVRADNVDFGGGRGEVSGQEQAIRTLAGARTVADLAALPIALPGGRKVRLDELGTVTDGAAEPRTFARLFDEPIVAFGVKRSNGASDVTVDQLVAKRLERIRADHPEVTFTKVDTQVDNEIGNYRSTMETLIEGALLAVVVVFVFLRDLRATIITAIALPLSIIPTFWAMNAIGFSLNLVSLLAITLVTGILVDDAIVEIENIERHMRMGKSAYRASLEAADEIGLGGHRDFALDRRDIRARQLHERHRRPIFPPVRPHRRDRGAVFAAGRALSDAGRRRLFPARAARGETGGRRVDARLHLARARLRAPPLDHADRRRDDLCRLRFGRRGCCPRASFPPTIWAACCSPSSCRRVRGLTTRTASRARSPTNCARCPKCGPR